MSLDQLAQLFQSNIIGLIVKLFLLLFIFLYGIFAAIVMRQVQLMNRVVTEVGFSPLLFTVALVHFGAVVGLFVLALVLV